MRTQYTWFAKVMKSGSNEAPISGAEMNLIRKCKLGENSAEIINWRVCNTEQCVHVHVTPENICCIFSIAFPDTTPIAVNQWRKIRPHEGINKQVKKTTKKNSRKGYNRHMIMNVHQKYNNRALMTLYENMLKICVGENPRSWVRNHQRH